MKKFSAKTVVAIGIGSALFFVLGRYLTIPVFANTTLNIQYAILAFFAVVYGPVAGMLIGLIGHTLIDVTLYGPWWSWIVTSGIVGLLIGIVGKRIDIESGTFGKKEIITFNVGALIANAIGWVLVAPVLDIIIYAEPRNKVFTQGVIAGSVNFLTTAVIGTIILIAYSKTRTQKGSLHEEE